jgi:hypothetical protein
MMMQCHIPEEWNPQLTLVCKPWNLNIILLLETSFHMLHVPHGRVAVFPSRSSCTQTGNGVLSLYSFAFSHINFCVLKFISKIQIILWFSPCKILMQLDTWQFCFVSSALPSVIFISFNMS